MEGEGLENLTTWSTTWPLWMSSHLSTSTVVYKTDLAFCASYKNWTSTSRELHWAIKHTHTKSHDSKELLSDKYEINSQSHNHLVERKDGTIGSCTACIIAIPKWLSFKPGYVLQEGLTSPSELVSVL